MQQNRCPDAMFSNITGEFNTRPFLEKLKSDSKMPCSIP